MKSIIFVCTGNTCRSPMAEGLFNKLAMDSGLDTQATSAGLWAANGMKVSDHAVEAVESYDVDISDHKSRPLMLEDVLGADVILTMTEGHKMQLVNALDGKVDSVDNIYTLKEYVGHLDNKDIMDPFGMDLNTYIRTAEDIHENIVKLMIMLNKSNN